MSIEETGFRARSAAPRWRRAAAPLACALALGFGLPAFAPRAALAEEGGPDEGSGGNEELERKIKAQMDKILRLMRENEKALLEAASRGGKKPAGVDVTPPDAPPAMEGAQPSAGTPPSEGGQVRREIDELIRLTTQNGGTIPKELEELVKMIPT